MARFMLRKEDPWIAADGPDIRGWQVLTREGRMLGLVEDVFVDPHDNVIEAFVIASGREFIPADAKFGDGIIYVEAPPEPLAVTDPNLPPAPPPNTSREPGSFDAHFRAHFERTFANARQGFEAYLPAYHFGREQALEHRFSGRPYARAEEDLVALFELSHPGMRFSEVRGAVRYGFEAGSSLKPTRDLDQLRDGGMPAEFNWDRDQIRPVHERMSVEQAERTASDMSMGAAPQSAPQDGSMTEQQRANRAGA